MEFIKIIKVITNKIFSWNKYIFLYVSLLNLYFNPSINENKFLYLLHTSNYIIKLNTTEVIIKKNRFIISCNN
jgi:hypothetical protein